MSLAGKARRKRGSGFPTADTGAHLRFPSAPVRLARRCLEQETGTRKFDDFFNSLVAAKKKIALSHPGDASVTTSVLETATDLFLEQQVPIADTANIYGTLFRHEGDSAEALDTLKRLVRIEERAPMGKELSLLAVGYHWRRQAGQDKEAALKDLQQP